MKTSKYIVAAIVMAALIAVGLGRALADDDSDRAGLLEQIDDKLDDIADKVSSARSDDDDRRIEEADSIARDLGKLVEQLDRVKGDDDHARRIVDRYPGYLRQFGDATRRLSVLKERQAEGPKLAAACKSFNDELSGLASASKDDPRGLEELLEKARERGRRAQETWNEAKRTKDLVDRANSEESSFSVSDDKWSSVSSAVQSTASASAGAWNRDYDQARPLCEEAQKGEHQGKIEEAVTRLSGSRAGRAEIRTLIDQKLATIAGDVHEVDSQSDDSRVTQALDVLTDVETLLGRLKDTAGDDEASRRLAEDWSSWAKELRPAVSAMRDAKRTQHRADEGPDKCQAAEHALQEQIRAYVGDVPHHTEAIERLPQEARAEGEVWRAKVDGAKKIDEELARQWGTAKSFTHSDGPWGPIRDNLATSGERTYLFFHKKLEETEKACEHLVLGERNPDVERAVDQMKRDTGDAESSYRGLREEFKRWKADVDQLREFTSQDVAEIRAAFCRAPDAGDYEEVDDVADRWASRLNAQYGSITGEADRIKAAADVLISKGRALKAGPKVKEAVDRILASIAKLKDYELQGSNNPLLKAQAAYGVSKHKEMQGSCDAREITISSSYCQNPHPDRQRSDCRLDCMKDCTVVEIKPEGPAERLGKAQAKAYRQGLENMYKDLGAKMFTGDFEYFARCEKDNHLVLDDDVETYDFCKDASTLGSNPQPVTTDVPERAE